MPQKHVQGLHKPEKQHLLLDLLLLGSNCLYKLVFCGKKVQTLQGLGTAATCSRGQPLQHSQQLRYQPGLQGQR